MHIYASLCNFGNNKPKLTCSLAYSLTHSLTFSSEFRSGLCTLLCLCVCVCLSSQSYLHLEQIDQVSVMKTFSSLLFLSAAVCHQLLVVYVLQADLLSLLPANDSNIVVVAVVVEQTPDIIGR